MFTRRSTKLETVEKMWKFFEKSNIVVNLNLITQLDEDFFFIALAFKNILLKP